MRPLPKLSDGPVWVIEVSALHSTPCGAAMSEWEELTPGRRYTPDEVNEFEDTLVLDDMFGLRWRARVHPQFRVHAERRLFARREFDVFERRVTRCAPQDLPVPAPSAWAYMTAALTGA